MLPLQLSARASILCPRFDLTVPDCNDICGHPAGNNEARARPTASWTILQGMPCLVFGKKTDYELRAIYEYLRAIPSLPNNYDKPSNK
jgi:hypothetical protein